jgi:universal stress protein E
MKAVRRILVGIKDPGARASPAVVKAACLAEAFGAKLTLFHAITSPVAAEAFLYAKGGVREFEQGVRDRRLDRLESMAEQLRGKKLEVDCAAEWDYPVHDAIVRQARASKADVVVVEAHAGRRLAPWLLHLTDWELLRISPLPVLVVKSARTWRRPRVLAAIDPLHAYAKPAGLDTEILDAAGQVTAALGGRLHVMHAYAPLPGAETAFLGASERVLQEIVNATESEARRAFDHALRETRVPRSRRHLVRGAASEAIPRTARARRARIVVMGAVSRSALKRLIIGNTAERVLGDLPCDALVVKPARFVTRVSRTRRGIRYAVSTKGPIS